MKSLKGSKIVLIGGAGFIGHHLAIDLKLSGASVYVIDSLQVNNLFSFMSTLKPVPSNDLYLAMLRERLFKLRSHNIDVIVDDARNYHDLSRHLGEIEPNVVIQLAAVAHADRSNKDPYSTFDHSLRTLENALDASRGKIDQFIYFSSSMVYGNFVNDIVTENDPCNPLGIYGALKFAGEKLVIAYGNVFDLPYTIVRPSALYGERCVSRRVIQCIVEDTIANRAVEISGDGNERLDFTYISDLVSGVKLMVNNPKAMGEVFNLTYGESRSILDVVNEVKNYFPDIKINFKERDRLTPKRGTLEVSKAKNLLGYDPKFSIHQGIKKYIDWYNSANINEYETEIIEDSASSSLQL